METNKSQSQVKKVERKQKLRDIVEDKLLDIDGCIAILEYVLNALVQVQDNGAMNAFRLAIEKLEDCRNQLRDALSEEYKESMAKK